MRWIVEVSSSVGRADAQKVVVEAESWQRALQAARAQRGEEGPMSGFSIELLEEGYRAVDPVAKIRFVVKRAPDDTPITAPLAKDGKGVAPSPPSTASPPEPSKGTKAPSVPPKANLKKKSIPPRPTAEKANGPSSKSAPPAAVEAATNTVPAPPPTPEDAPATAPDAFVPPAVILQPVGMPTPGLPAVKVLTSRAQDPTEASPLAYREYSFAVSPGTTEDVAVNVLRAQLKLVDATIATAKMGKLVNLAIWDAEFTGKPPAPPLATLTWKDWKGEPVIGYPRRGAGPKQVKPPGSPESIPPMSSPTPPPASTNAPASNRAPTATAIKAMINAAKIPSTPPKAPPQTQPVTPAAPAVSDPFGSTTAPLIPGAPPAAPMPVAVPMPIAAPVPVAAPHGAIPAQVPVAFPVPIPHAIAATPIAPPASPHAAVAPPPPAVAVPVQVVAPVAVFTPTQPGSLPPVAVGAHSFPGGGALPGAMPRRPSSPGMSPDGMIRTPSGRFVRGRITGDELITALFESMHDLHFLRDALDGGQFCLALATEVLPSRVALIHFFDIEKREWVVACTRGKDANRLLNLRTPESDEMLLAAARRRRAVVTPNASAASAQRYQQIGGSRSLIIAPIMQAGRALGALEIINPLDGMPFNEDEGNAMTYIAEQYAEYLGSRGIVLDRDRIQAAATR